MTITVDSNFMRVTPIKKRSDVLTALESRFCKNCVESWEENHLIDCDMSEEDCIVRGALFAISEWDDLPEASV